jgi:DNA-binding XRE family transcriptional regulator
MGVKNRVRQVRREMDLTQEEVCRRAKISKWTLIRVERHADHVPAYATMFAIARALGRSVDSLFFAPVDDAPEQPAEVASA